MTMYRVRTEFTGVTGSPWLNTLFFDVASGTAQQAATAAGVFWGAADTTMNSAVLWETEPDVTLIDEVSGDATGVTATTPSSGAGSSASDRLPVANQALVRLRTGIYVAGREIRGRIFVPGLSELDSTLGELTSTTQTALNTAIGVLIGTANAQLVVWSKTHHQFAPVTSGSTWGQFAVLRSRRD